MNPSATDVALLLEYMAHNDSRLSQLVPPAAWDQVDVPRLVSMLNGRKDITTFPLKLSAHNALPLTPRATGHRRTRTAGSRLVHALSSPAPSPQSPSPSASGICSPENVSLPDFLSSNSAGAKSASSPRQPASSPTKAFKRITGLSAKLFRVLPLQREQRTLAFEHFLLISGLYAFPEELRKRPAQQRRAFARNPPAAVSSAYSSAYAPLKLPARRLVASIDNPHAHFLASEIRKNVPLSAPKACAVAAFLRALAPPAHMPEDTPPSPLSPRATGLAESSSMTDAPASRPQFAKRPQAFATESHRLAAPGSPALSSPAPCAELDLGSLTGRFVLLGRLLHALGGDIHAVSQSFAEISTPLLEFFHRSVSSGERARRASLREAKAVSAQQFAFLSPDKLAEAGLGASGSAVLKPTWDSDSASVVFFTIRSSGLLCAGLSEWLGALLVTEGVDAKGQAPARPCPVAALVELAKLLVASYLNLVTGTAVDTSQNQSGRPLCFRAHILAKHPPPMRAAVGVPCALKLDAFLKLLRGFLSRAARVFVTIQMFARRRGYTALVAQPQPLASFQRAAALPLTLMTDIGFGVFSLLRGADGYLFRLPDIVDGLARLFAAAHGCGESWGYLMPALIAAAALFVNGRARAEADRRVRKQDVGIFAAYAITSLNKALDSSPGASPPTPPCPCPSPMAHLAQRFTAFLREPLSNYRELFGVAPDVLDPLVEAIACGAQLRARRALDVEPLTLFESGSSNPQPCPTPSVSRCRASSASSKHGERFTTPTLYLQKTPSGDLRAEPAQLQQTFSRYLLLPLEWSGGVCALVAKAVRSNAQRVFRNRFADFTRWFDVLAPDSEETVRARVPEARRGTHGGAGADTDADASPSKSDDPLDFFEPNTFLREPSPPAAREAAAAESALRARAFDRALKDIQLEAFAEGCGRLARDISVETETFLPKFSHFSRAVANERTFVAETRILESAFTEYARVTMAELEGLLAATFFKWPSISRIHDVAQITDAIRCVTAALRPCVKRAQVFSLFVLLDRQQHSVCPDDPSEEGSNAAQLKEAQAQVFPRRRHLTREVLSSPLLRAGGRAAWKASGEASIARADIERLILADWADIKSARERPEQSTLKLSFALGLQLPSRCSEVLLSRFFGEISAKFSAILGRTIEDERITVSTLYEDRDEVAVDAGTLPGRETLEHRFASSIGCDFATFLEALLVDLTKTHSGDLPVGLGQNERLPLTSNAVSGIVSFFATNLRCLLDRIAHSVTRAAPVPPSLTPLFVDKKLKKFSKLASQLSPTSPSSSAAAAQVPPTVAPPAPVLSQAERVEMSWQRGLTVPGGLPMLIFSRLPHVAGRALPLPFNIVREKDFMKVDMKARVSSEREMLRKVVVSLLRLNAFETVGWYALRFKKTLTEIARRVSNAEALIAQILSGDAGPEPEPEGPQEGALLLQIEGAFSKLRAHFRETRKRIMDAVVLRALFQDLKPLFQALYFPTPSDVCFCDALYDVMLHVLQVSAGTVFFPLLKPYTKRLFLFLNSAMATVILDTGPRARVFNESSYRVLKKDFKTAKALFVEGQLRRRSAADGQAAPGERFFSQRYVNRVTKVYALSVRFNRRKYVTKYDAAKVNRAQLRNCMIEVADVHCLPSTDIYIRVLNGWRYSHKGVRGFMQALKKKAV
eukprot:gnl/Chilomastix_cuspidata/3785.p1 GENE.gnl/Chilomastix_cuspidata/3785~~gnl/Chilomastix_cuspidata/3785.p1  ORF type:complete len:1670 (+),score=650.21 gnl/Chilomastix_cuspidata/3785:4564-9573(+)